MRASWQLMTPSGPGAVAIIQIVGDVDEAVEAIGLGPVVVGKMKLIDLAGVDRGLAVRWSEDMIQLMPHGGQATIRGLVEVLDRAGIHESLVEDPIAAYPEAADEIEARMLAVLARASSPLAVDLLLEQPKLWARPDASSDPERDQVLGRLLEAPLVIAVGPPNVGKSSLVNALAGRSVAVVSDEPGTTRDHVGVVLDLGGLVVRYVDTPGARAGAGPIEAKAAQIASEAVRGADMVICAGDVTAGPLVPPGAAGRVLIIQTRADLGPVDWEHELEVSIERPASILALAAAVREILVPVEAIEERRAWRFWAD